MIDINHNLIKGCPLCEIFLDRTNNLKTKLYHPQEYEIIYNDFIIIDCDTCKVPMVVIRDHVSDIPSELWGRILYRCKKMFGNDIRLRTKSRTIHDHWHAHIIKPKRY